jgi:hypothetical protein
MVFSTAIGLPCLSFRKGQGNSIISRTSISTLTHHTTHMSLFSLSVKFVKYKIDAYLVTKEFFRIKPSGTCDPGIGRCRLNGLLIPRSPFSRHPPIRRHALPQRTSHWCISSKISKLQWTLSVPKTWKLTIMWRHMATMALRGLRGYMLKFYFHVYVLCPCKFDPICHYEQFMLWKYYTCKWCSKGSIIIGLGLSFQMIVCITELLLILYHVITHTLHFRYHRHKHGNSRPFQNLFCWCTINDYNIKNWNYSCLCLLFLFAWCIMYTVLLLEGFLKTILPPCNSFAHFIKLRGANCPIFYQQL